MKEIKLKEMNRCMDKLMINRRYFFCQRPRRHRYYHYNHSTKWEIYWHGNSIRIFNMDGEPVI